MIRQDSWGTIHGWHLLVAVLFFGEFFLLGHPLVGHHDVVQIDLPLFLQAQREFLQGRLSWWQPGILAGVSGTGFASAPVMFFENWLLFLLPEPWLLPVSTLVLFFKLFLVGVVSWHWFYAELSSRRWALFASLAYQGCGWMWWSMAAFGACSILFYFTLLGWLVWSFHKRRPSANFFWMTLCTLGMLFAGNVSYASFILVPLGLMVWYRAATANSAGFDWKLFTTALMVAAGCVAVFAGLRVMPVLAEMAASQRSAPCCPPAHVFSGLLLLRLFLPEIFSVTDLGSLAVFGQFAELPEGVHLFTGTLQSFGVVTALLVLLALLTVTSRQALVVGGYTLVVLGLLGQIAPFDTLLLALFYPFYHETSLQFWLPAPFCVLAGYGGMALERLARQRLAQPVLRRIMGFVLLLLPLILGVTILRYQGESSQFATLRGWPLGCVLLLAGVWLAHGRWPDKMVGAARLLLGLGGLAALAWLGITLEEEGSFAAFVRYELAALLPLATLLGWLMASGKATPWWPGLALMSGLAVVAYPWVKGVYDPITLQQTTVLALLGLLRYLLVAAIFWGVLSGLQRREYRFSRIFRVLLVVLLVEVLTGMMVQRQLTLNPFIEARELFTPSQSRMVLPDSRERVNSRLSHPIQILNLPIHRPLFAGSEGCTSTHLAMDLRTYGGYYNLIPRGFAAFMQAMNPGQFSGIYQDICAYAHHTDPRLLDLLAVGITLDPATGQVVRRPSALGRMTWFGEWQVVAGFQEALRRLQAADFDHHRQVLVVGEPGVAGTVTARTAQPVTLTEEGPDRLWVEVVQEQAGILAFLDVFHPGWRVWVDDQPASVLRINGPFMGVALPPGRHRVVWRFFPGALAAGLPLALLGLTFLLAVAAVLAWRDCFCFVTWRRSRRCKTMAGVQGGSSPPAGV